MPKYYKTSNEGFWKIENRIVYFYIQGEFHLIASIQDYDIIDAGLEVSYKYILLHAK